MVKTELTLVLLVESSLVATTAQSVRLGAKKRSDEGLHPPQKLLTVAYQTTSYL